MSAATGGLVAIARVEDLTMMEGRAVTVGGRRIAIFKTLDGFRAVDAVCPHKGGPLELGLLSDERVVCPLHNWAFELKTGRCVSGGDPIAVHNVIERDGWVYLEREG
jgi:NAD(P)H-dependent nitrite reductase small subunit